MAVYDIEGPLPIFFAEKSKGHHIPRAVMTDFDSSVLDNIRSGYYNDYDMDKLISGKEDAVTYARGYYSVGPYFLEPTLDRIRKAVNECENLQGIFVFHSLGGGTGSGFGSLLMDHIAHEFSKQCRFEYAIYPAYRTSTFPGVLGPYNSLLSTDKNLDAFDCSIFLDNQAMHGMCQKKLGVELPAYPELNRIVAQVVSATTSPFRFHNTLNVNLTEFQVNLFPFPKAHFPVIGLAPVLKQSKALHEPSSVKHITYEAFELSSQMLECDLARGVYMACCLLYRGDICPKDINMTLTDMIKYDKNCLKFMDCCPTGFKVGLNNQPIVIPSYWEMYAPTRCVCTMSNSTAISMVWKKMIKMFDSMFKKRAFLHWYLSEGMDQQEFVDAQANMEAFATDYITLENSPASQFTDDEDED